MNPMSEKELMELRQSSDWYMRSRMEEIQKEFRLDAYPQFAWDTWRGELIFSSGGVPKVVARIQVVGSLSPKGDVWTWAWAKSELLAPVRQAALRVRQLGEERGVPAFVQPKWAGKESDAWQMTAITGRLVDAKGAFKSPGPDGSTFMVFSEIRTVSDRKRVFGVRACAHVLDGERPILLVSREPDGEVLAVCGGEDDSVTTARNMTLDRLLRLDGSLAELADLPDGWIAHRDAPDQDWARSKPE